MKVALALADNGKKMKQFADVLATHCVDQRYLHLLVIVTPK